MKPQSGLFRPMLCIKGLKVQYVILTASSWNWHCSPNSKYHQTWRSHGL